MSGILISFDDPPRVEYVTEDRVVIHRRVDERMDVLLDMETREVCGFTLYGKWSPADPDPKILSALIERGRVET